MLNDTQYLYITNNSADVMAIADSAGNIIANYSYNEWGEVTVNATGNNLTIANLNPLRYRGYYYDSETGYYYLQSRYYDPEICRFINADLPEYASEQKNETAGINIFVYCCNDAVNNIDTDGYKKKKKLWKKIARWGYKHSYVHLLKGFSRTSRVKNKFKKYTIYYITQTYTKNKWYNREEYVFETYGGKVSEWNKLFDEFKKKLSILDIGKKISEANTTAALAKLVLKKSFSKINVFLTAVGITYEYLTWIANGVLDKIAKETRNKAGSKLYCFNLIEIYYQNTPFYHYQSVVNAYTSGIWSMGIWL